MRVKRQGDACRFSFVRPAWAHSCGCKSRRKVVTSNEAKRNCLRATERGKEARTLGKVKPPSNPKISHHDISEQQLDALPVR